MAKRTESAPPSDFQIWRPAASRILHQGAQVIHPFFERRHGDPIGQAGAALVEHDQPRERGETLEVPALVGVLPLQLEVRDEWWNVNEVEGPVAANLICDVHFARLRVPGLRDFEHVRQSKIAIAPNFVAMGSFAAS